MCLTLLGVSGVCVGVLCMCVECMLTTWSRASALLASSNIFMCGLASPPSGVGAQSLRFMSFELAWLAYRLALPRSCSVRVFVYQGESCRSGCVLSRR